LLHAAKHPDLLDTNTGAALDNAHEAGVLSKGDHACLSEAWRLYTALSQVIRMCVGGNLDPEKTSEAGKALLCKVAQCRDFEELNAVISLAQTKVRAVFRKLMDGK
jgi:glutamate-ammonia-ligase adenylyltransferase